MRLNSRTSIEGSTVSYIHCDGPLHSGIRAPESVMSTGGQITDSVGPYAPCQSLACLLVVVHRYRRRRCTVESGRSVVNTHMASKSKV